MISLDGLVLERDTEDVSLALFAYHSIVYLPIAGALYELDRLEEFAVHFGRGYNAQGERWLRKSREVIDSQIGTYLDGALRIS